MPNKQTFGGVKLNILPGSMNKNLPNGGTTLRIIPLSKWLLTIVIVSPLSRAVPLPNGHFMVCKQGLYPNYLHPLG